MKPADDRCEEHGLYLYRTGFGWSCKLGCYYCDDPQKIKERFIKQYKKELKNKINNIFRSKKVSELKEEILELLK
jgi:hypothetical protein